MGKRFCRECGSEMGEDEKFCRSCGTPVDSADAKEETVGQKVDNSIEDVKNKISSGKSGSKLNIKIIVPIVAIIVIIFLAWAVTSAFSGHDIEVGGQKFHVDTKYSKSDMIAQKFAKELSDFHPDDVVCYIDNSSYEGDYFVIFTKNVGSKTLSDMGISGEPLTINGKQGVLSYYQTSNVDWGIDQNAKYHNYGYEKLDAFSYINDGEFVTVVLGPGAGQDALKNIIK